MAIFENKLAKNGHFFGPLIQKWPKIDPENVKIRKRSDSTLGLAQLAHNMKLNAKGLNSRLHR